MSVNVRMYLFLCMCMSTHVSVRLAMCMYAVCDLQNYEIELSLIIARNKGLVSGISSSAKVETHLKAC